MKDFTFDTKYNTNINISILHIIKALGIKGDLAWEYNPLKNLKLERTDIDNKQTLLQDFVTKDLNFDENHPIDIKCLESYDGSVNLILNDNYNPPKLINTRFTPRQNMTYEIIDRIGVNDTNIYDYDHIPELTSLYKLSTTIPIITFNGITSGGNLKVGNYIFYFKLADSDGNLTDIIGQTGLVSCFIGDYLNISSVRGGSMNENSNKLVKLLLNNLDSNYTYVLVYYSRSTSNINSSEYTTEYFEINLKYLIKGGGCTIVISGIESALPITEKDINSLYFVIDKAKCSEMILTRLFLGNILKTTFDYEKLRDLSLRICPYYEIEDASNLGIVNQEYRDYNNLYGYYNPNHIYKKVGYWPNELYRFGIVYILKNNQTTPVFNIRGCKMLPSNVDYYALDKLKDIVDDHNVWKYISYDETTGNIQGYPLDNCFGVVRFPICSNDYIIHPNFYILSEVQLRLKELGIKGYFFVRQKRIPTILCLAKTAWFNPNAGIPLDENGYHHSIIGDSKRSYTNIKGKEVEGYLLGNSIVKSGFKKNVMAAYCPEFELNQAYYNNIFTGGLFTLLNNDGTKTTKHNIIGVTTGCTSAFIGDLRYSEIVGNALDLTFRTLAWNDNGERDWKNNNDGRYGINVEEKLPFVVRGIWGPYLGLTLDYSRNTAGDIVNIYIPDYSESRMDDYFKIRYFDSSEFFSISERYTINENTEIKSIYRGDSYITMFTHRILRNFSDPDAPTNDRIVQAGSFYEGFWGKGGIKIDHINYDDDGNPHPVANRGDMNAVPLGAWITFKVRSTINLGLRDIDGSYPSEVGLYGHKRGFYPFYPMSTAGEYKIPESTNINKGFEQTIGGLLYYAQPDIPYIKNNFEGRIIYSLPTASDAFINGCRIFEELNYQDYSLEYGGLVKFINLLNNLLVVFEHGIGIITVNERVQTADAGNVYIHAKDVLSPTLVMISDTYGSLWAESVVKTDRFVYGVDTVAKKIWRTNGLAIELISDGTVNKFLIEHISLSEREFTPIPGIRDVKTHYNANKKDVMFVFYDEDNQDDICWNLCYNEELSRFITFYSWIPSNSANIDNMFFSFDRDTTKGIISLSQTAHSYKGLTVKSADSKDLYEIELGKDCELDLIYDCKNYKLEIEHDSYGYYKYCTLKKEEKDYKLIISKDLLNNPNVKEEDSEKVMYINIRATSYNTESITELIVNSVKIIVAIPIRYDKLYTNFWKHGLSGIIDIKDKIFPCRWYDKQHPFEFEFVVGQTDAQYKQFTNLQLTSNKVKPTSIHYDFLGESYNFAEDKKNMYYRQEALKAFYQYNGCDITFNKKFTSIIPSNPSSTNIYKATHFPLYYTRLDRRARVEDSYIKLHEDVNFNNYSYLTGAEIVWNELLNEFRICNHTQVNDIAKVSRLRGNALYLNDSWQVQISPIIIYLNNITWKNKAPYFPLYVNNPPGIVDETIKKEISNIILNGDSDSKIIPPLLSGEPKLSLSNLKLNSFKEMSNSRTEFKPMDKYIKIRVRYEDADIETPSKEGINGKTINTMPLAVIQSVQTIYNTFIK